MYEKHFENLFPPLRYRPFAQKTKVLKVLFLSFSGLLSWDVGSCHVELSKELDLVNNAAPPGEELKGGKQQQFCSIELGF